MWKKIKDIIYIIVLGAIGSGVWVGIGQPAFGWFSNLVTMLGASISMSYLDFLYKGLGYGGFEDRGSAIFIVFLLFTVIIFFSKSMLSLISSVNWQIRSLLICVLIVTWIISILLINKVAVSHKANLYIRWSIDIVSPYISQKDKLLIISEYRHINDHKSFKSFESLITKISKENNLGIETFSNY